MLNEPPGMINRLKSGGRGSSSRLFIPLHANFAVEVFKHVAQNKLYILYHGIIGLI
jgi:hypothetical protein